MSIARYIYYTIAVAVLLNFVKATENNNFKLELEASWSNIDFLPSFIEAIVGFNDSLYEQTIETIFGLGDTEVELEDDASDQEIYSTVINSLRLTDQDLDFINFDLTNKKHTPRIAAHYDHYSDVLTKFGDRLKSECAKDSFGNAVETKNGQIQTWLLYNDKIYCSANDLFALRTDLSSHSTLLFDRIIGKSKDAPLVILYGNPTEELTKDFLKILYPDAKAGKLKFVWRYIPLGIKKLNSISGYGVSLKMEKYDYSGAEGNPKYDLSRDFTRINESQELVLVNGKHSYELGVKLTSFILSNRYKTTKYDLLDTILTNFPKFIPYIARLPKLLNHEKVKSKVLGNEDIGLSQDSYGIYINGSPINPLELDIYNLGTRIKEELQTVKDLVKLGFDTVQAKLLIAKFALLSAVKQTQFRNGNTLMGNNENRFKVYENEFKKGSSEKGGVLFFNNIESDNTFKEYTTDREEAYLGVGSHKLKPNQIPLLKENIHDLIFALNFGNKNQLRVFFTLSKVILDSGIPQQVGVLPVIGDDPMDLLLAEKFYWIAEKSSTQEALAILYKYFESNSPDEVDDLLDKVEVPEDYKVDYNHVLNKFSISTASVIFNGVIYDLRAPNWQIAMSKQISQDISLIKTFLRQGPIEGRLKDVLYSNAKSERNLRIIPLEPSDIIYKKIDKELINNSIAFKKLDKAQGVSGTFWLVSDFTKSEIITQLIDLLLLLKKKAIQIRIINTGDTDVFGKLKTKFKLTALTNGQIDEIIEILKKSNASSANNDELKKMLETKQLPAHHSFLLFNSRYFRLDGNFGYEELDQIIEFEVSQRLNLIPDIMEAYPDEFRSKKVSDFNLVLSGLDNMDWFDLVTSIVTKSFHVDEKRFIVDVNRFDFSSLDFSNSIDVTTYEENSPVDVLIILNPMDEYSQKLISLVNSITDFLFLNIRILLQPRVDLKEEIKIHKFYRGVYPQPTPKFDSNGKWIQHYSAQFESIPSNVTYSTELDVPHKWIVVPQLSSMDLNTINFSESHSVDAKYSLKNILIEGYARDIHTGKAPDGLIFRAFNKNYSTDTLVMTSLDYFQIKGYPSIFNFSTTSNDTLLSASENKYQANTEELESIEVPVFKIDGSTIYPRVMKSGNNKPMLTRKHADINIFTIAGGQLYEKLTSIMIASVRKHNPSLTIKFWILEDFVTPQFKHLVELISIKYNVEYEFISYKWPNFLRKQKTKERMIWGYKILFLDVLFPQDLNKIIFIDADQICRADLTELVNMDLEGAPYGFTPMCDSREEMEGFRFWKEGYWSDVLKDDLKYHISALFVVDLQKFRSIKAGDRLRAHYQKLSSDPNSLSNLDQDLPNNMQRLIKIFSLPQNWLWCETWCSDKSLEDAKMIDLCNNPLTRENKLDAAKRLIPEWIEYEQEIEPLVSLVQNNTAKEVVQEIEIDTDGEQEEQEQESNDDDFIHDEL